MPRRPTHHSTGPAQKAAQAGEFKRWASVLIVDGATERATPLALPR